jgi:hypothetical protein
MSYCAYQVRSLCSVKPDKLSNRWIGRDVKENRRSVYTRNSVWVWKESRITKCSTTISLTALKPDIPEWESGCSKRISSLMLPGFRYGIFLTGSLWRRQSQQSFNTLTPFNFLFYLLQVSAPTGHPQVRYKISYYFCFWRNILIQRIRCTYAIWL